MWADIDESHVNRDFPTYSHATVLREETVSLLKDNMPSLEEIANALLEKETIYESEIDSIIERNRKKIA